MRGRGVIHVIHGVRNNTPGYDCSKDQTPTPDGGGPSFWNSMTIGGASLSNDNIQPRNVPKGGKELSWVFDGSYILKMWNEFANTNHISLAWLSTLHDDFPFNLMIRSSSKKREKPCLMLHYLAWSACLCKREAASKKPKTYKAHNAIPRPSLPNKALKAWHTKFHRIFFRVHIFIFNCPTISHMIPICSGWVVWLIHDIFMIAW